MCWKCGKEITIHSPVARSEVCPICDADVRVCKNCSHYEVGSQYDCKEHISEIIKDKERANFCDWFSLTEIVSNTKFSAQDKVVNARNQFTALFGD